MNVFAGRQARRDAQPQHSQPMTASDDLRTNDTANNLAELRGAAAPASGPRTDLRAAIQTSDLLVGHAHHCQV
ncbi:MAG TPA: hypothetical protein VIQ11_05915, partial [Mycobacterium sp.]